MSFEEPGSVAWLYEGDKKVAKIKVDTTVVLKNLKTNKEYDSDAEGDADVDNPDTCLLYTSPSPRDGLLTRMPSSA